MLLIKGMIKLYKYFVFELADPRTKEWLFVGSPIYIAFILSIYLLLVCEWLPQFMKNRQPYELKNTLRVYNFLQVLANAYLVIEGSSIIFGLNWKCAAIDYSYNPTAIKTAKLQWFYFILKIVDLLDTVFFVLRKRERQITFLHLYHHFAVVIITWIGINYVPGGEGFYLTYFNAFIHVLMYGYYLLCTFPVSKEWLLQWKQKVTQMQLMQFCLLALIYFPKVFYQCDFPKLILILGSTQNFFMLFMFGDFYYKNYIVSAKKI